jgi:hypothetical protein
MVRRLLNIVFSGMVAADPYQGGATWAVLQYVLGLRELGHNVVLIEPVPAISIQPAGSSISDSINARYFRQVMAEFDLSGIASLVAEGTEQTVGMPYDELVEFCDRADILINVSGMLTDSQLIDRIPIRIYLDLDPAFIQIWNAVYGIDMRLDRHTDFVTVGLALGTPLCPAPTCGKEWLHTFQPIVLSHWPRARETRYNALTTIGNWRGYGSVEYQGEFYGQKAHSLRELIDLPRRTNEKFMVAMAIHPDETRDLGTLAQSDWQLLDPSEVAGTPQRYRQFIQQSKAEFAVAKSGYVKSKSGWFSDRSVCYLASGRPVIAQDTGFSEFLPTRNGLFAFKSVEDAVSCIHEMNDDYDRHADAARELAETYFRSDRVLTQLLQKVGAMP